jgi:L-rhamnose mutarotase
MALKGLQARAEHGGFATFLLKFRRRIFGYDDPGRSRSVGESRMQRVAFLLRLLPGTESAYDKAHAEVWPEMLALLKRAGISEYSIFRRDQLLFLTMHVEDFDQVWARIEADPVNTKWQQAMSPYFAPLDPLRPGERLPMMREIFYMP